MHLTDNFPIIHKPLIFYGLIKLLNVITHWVVLPYAGFKMYTFDLASIQENAALLQAEVSDSVPSHTYWLREVPGSKESPFVILHGISHGWFSYLSSIRAMCSSRSVLLVDLHDIKMGSIPSFALAPMPTPKGYVNFLQCILSKHAIEKITLVGHSFGSFTCSWFLKELKTHSNPSLCVEHLILVDPVSILLSLSDVAVNFLYRSPKTFMERLIYIFASRDVQVAKCLWRNFSWYDNVLFLEDLPAHCSCTIIVAGKDDILHASAVKAYSDDFAKQDVPKGVRRDVIWFPDMCHGEALYRKDCLEEICASLKKTQEVIKLANDTENPVSEM
jgi:pimeloyl-ACP methyl ester carboxylesterase